MNFNVTVCALIFNFIPFSNYCQDAHPTSAMLRLFEDNDFINIRFSGSDKAYTHGLKADLFYIKKDEKPAFDERLMLKAGTNSVKTYGWGITQTMVTPNDLSKPEIVASDYRYACSITLSRTRHSSNPVRKYNLQTEYVVGLLGPIALGKETQDAMHKLIHDEMPRGWNSQLKTSALLNINLTAEKQLCRVKKSIECIGGVKSSAGTSLTSLSVYTLLRVGKMNPYFNGYLTQYVQQGKGTESWQLYILLRPSLDFVLRNAHIQGGTFRPERDEMNREKEAFPPRDQRRLNRIGCGLDYGLVVTLKKVSITFTQRDLYAMIKEQTRHEVGNISIYVAL
jgi:hypothetical protein